jgi:hypothetical protein
MALWPACTCAANEWTTCGSPSSDCQKSRRGLAIRRVPPGPCGGPRRACCHTPLEARPAASAAARSRRAPAGCEESCSPSSEKPWIAPNDVCRLEILPRRHGASAGFSTRGRIRRLGVGSGAYRTIQRHSSTTAPKSAKKTPGPTRASRIVLSQEEELTGVGAFRIAREEERLAARGEDGADLRAVERLSIVIAEQRGRAIGDRPDFLQMIVEVALVRLGISLAIRADHQEGALGPTGLARHPARLHGDSD